MNIKAFCGLVCAVGLAFAATEARAVYTISATTSPEQTVNVGSHGQSYFDVTFGGGGTFTYSGKQIFATLATDPDHNPTFPSPFSSLTVDAASTLKLGTGQSYSSGSTYRLIVDWTVASSAAPDSYGIYFNLFAKDPSSQLINAGATDIVNVQAVSVPEASQVASCAFLLLGGAVVYVGRRSFRRKVV